MSAKCCVPKMLRPCAGWPVRGTRRAIAETFLAQRAVADDVELAVFVHIAPDEPWIPFTPPEAIVHHVIGAYGSFSGFLGRSSQKIKPGSSAYPT